MSGSGAGGPRARAVLAALLAVAAAAPVAAPTDLGGQRVGTSLGAFLKIPIDARGSSMGGAVCSCVSGPAALYWNPAGLGVEPGSGVLVSGIDYVAGIPMGGFAASFPFEPFDGAVGVGFSGLRTEMDETDENHPLGTDRSFTYSAWTLMLGASFGLTDKLSSGLTAKAYRESLAPEVGGPTLTSWLIDAGVIYFVGFRQTRVGIALSNFGPDLRPAGVYDSHRAPAEIRYTGFSPPTFFRFGASVDPYQGERVQTTVALEIGHPADNREVVRLGFEGTLQRALALRAGYDFTADALRFNAGLGVRARLRGGALHVDYGYADGGFFGGVHRWTLRYLW
jgi:opacity protein-like surface antigen